MLRCPKCREIMEQEQASGHYGAKLSVFHCSSCSGIWVDRDVVFAISGESAIEIEPDIEIEDVVTEPREVPIYCPRCEVYLTEQTGPELPSGLRIDYCSACHGFWFDKGELMIYKTYLEEKRTKNKERLRESEKKAQERKKRQKQLERELGLGTGGQHSSRFVYYSGMSLARQLLRLSRFLS